MFLSQQRDHVEATIAVDVGDFQLHGTMPFVERPHGKLRLDRRARFASCVFQKQHMTGRSPAELRDSEINVAVTIEVEWLEISNAAEIADQTAVFPTVFLPAKQIDTAEVVIHRHEGAEVGDYQLAATQFAQDHRFQSAGIGDLLAEQSELRLAVEGGHLANPAISHVAGEQSPLARRRSQQLDLRDK